MSITSLRPERPNFFLETPPITSEDLTDIEISPQDAEVLDEFEECWRTYWTKRPDALIAGMKGNRIESIEDELEALRTSRHNVEAELQRQLDFFDSSRKQLEAEFKKEEEIASEEQKRIVNEMLDKIENVKTVSRNFEANAPWDFFLETLEEAVAQSDVKPLPGDGVSVAAASRTSNVLKPSAKAMFLNNANEENCAPDARSSNFLLRAYRIDHALLNSQVRTLQREVEKVEMKTSTLDFVGKFLTEHNIWSLMTNRGGNAGTVAGNSPSVFRGAGSTVTNTAE